MEIDKSFILWCLAGIVTLIIVAVKATIYKITSPLKDRVSDLEKQMTLIESSHKTIIDLIKKMPSDIEVKVNVRSESLNKDIKHIKDTLDRELNHLSQRLDSKQDKI